MRLLRLLEELNRQGTTVVIATHNEALVGRFDRPRLHLENGELRFLPSRPPQAEGAALAGAAEAP